MTESKRIVRRNVRIMWIATAFTVAVNFYAVFTGNPITIGVGLGVALSYAFGGIVLGSFAVLAHGRDEARIVR